MNSSYGGDDSDRPWAKEELLQLDDEVQDQHLRISEIALKHDRSDNEVRQKIKERHLSYEPSLCTRTPANKVRRQEETAAHERLAEFDILRPYVSKSISNQALIKNIEVAATHSDDEPIYLWDYVSKQYARRAYGSEGQHYLDKDTATVLGVKNNDQKSVRVASSEILKRIARVVQSNPIQSNPIQSNPIQSNNIVVCSVPSHNKSSHNSNGISKIAQIVATEADYIDGSNFIIRHKDIDKGISKDKTIAYDNKRRKVLSTISISPEGIAVINGSWVFLLDDVITTGFTYKLLRLLIYACGARLVTVVALGKTKFYNEKTQEARYGL